MRCFTKLMQCCCFKVKGIVALVLFLVSPIFILPSYAQRSSLPQKTSIQSRSLKVPVGVVATTRTPQPLSIENEVTINRQAIKSEVEESTDELKSTDEDIVVDVEEDPLNGSDEEYVPRKSTYGFGDANGDGDVNVMDVIMARNHILGKNPLTGGAYSRLAFVAADYSTIDVADVIIMQQFILGEIDDILGPFAGASSMKELLAQEEALLDFSHTNPVEYEEMFLGDPNVDLEVEPLNGFGFGDTNGDGEVNVGDIVLARNDILGIKRLTGGAFSRTAFAAPDFSTIDVNDIIVMRNYILGFIDEILGPFGGDTSLEKAAVVTDVQANDVLATPVVDESDSKVHLYSGVEEFFSFIPGNDEEDELN